MNRFALKAWVSVALVLALGSALLAQSNVTSPGAYERVFPQSRLAIEKALQQLLPSSAGRLPVLDGFVVPGERALDQYQRGYYQCTAHLTAAPSGGTLVTVRAKITAWYSSSEPGNSRYEVLPSNGRLESDFLARLQDTLAGQGSSALPAAPPSPVQSTKKAPDPSPTISAPMPGGSVLADAIAASKTPAATPAPPPNAPAPGADDAVISLQTRKAVADKHMEELKKEAKNLEDILHNQSQPNNLAAVKQSGTPVVASPNEGGKVLFLATAQDEFEILDLNASWVHVRISGLSRGWIRRSNVEMPEAFASSAPASAALPTPATDAKAFQVENEQTASFPGDWPALRGKTVAIISVQKSNPNASSADAQAKLEFAKTLFAKEYADLTQAASSAQGVVLIFDSADGGMVAATLPLLAQWKAGTLSDEAFWRRCYFDPPEMFRPAGQ